MKNFSFLYNDITIFLTHAENEEEAAEKIKKYVTKEFENEDADYLGELLTSITPDKITEEEPVLHVDF